MIQTQFFCHLKASKKKDDHMKCRDGISRIFALAHPTSSKPPPLEPIQVTRQTIKKLIAEIGELKNEVPVFFGLKITIFWFLGARFDFMDRVD